MSILSNVESRISVILDAYSHGDILFSNYTEAKDALAGLRKAQKELRALKRDVNAEMGQVRSDFQSKGVAVGKGIGTMVAGGLLGKKSVGKVNASRRDDVRRQKEIALTPYADTKNWIDDLIHTLDQAKHQVEMSKEYQEKPVKKRATKKVASKRAKKLLVLKEPKFFIFLDEKIKGGFTVDELEPLFKAEVINQDTLLCNEGEEDWHPLSHFFEVE